MASGDFGFLSLQPGQAYSTPGVADLAPEDAACASGTFEVTYPAGTVCSPNSICPAMAVLPRIALLYCDPVQP